MVDSSVMFHIFEIIKPGKLWESIRLSKDIYFIIDP
jgi:hypothetical protein